MHSYNYISNELPRELIETYNDLQSDLLRIIVKNLKLGTEPEKVFTQLQTKTDSYKPLIEKVTAVIFKDSENKTVKSNQKEFEKEETEEATPTTKEEANSIVQPLFLGAMLFIDQLNKKVVNGAYLRYTKSYQELNTGLRFMSGTERLRQVYKGVIKSGITIYESFTGGQPKNYSVENVLRRDVMTLVNKSNAEVNKSNFMKSSAKFIETSSHPTARTWNKYMKHPYEDHSSWQGKVYYSKDGEAVEGYEEFESTCGYGEMLGICGINCYHQFQMNYTGDTQATQYSDKEVERQYALSQQQRAMERAIRQLKQSRAVWEEAGEQKLADDISRNIRMATGTLKSFCEKNDLKYYNWRTQI